MASASDNPDSSLTSNSEPSTTSNPEPSTTCNSEPSTTSNPEPTTTCNSEPFATSNPEPSTTGIGNGHQNQQAILIQQQKELLEIFQRDGFSGVEARISQLNNEWKKQPVLIAIVGRTGTGKSSLIKRLLGLAPSDQNGPQVGTGVLECTKEIQQYPMLGSNVVYHDLPGVGSANEEFRFDNDASKKAYCDQFHLSSMDYFILLAKDRFQKYDDAFAEYIACTLKKPFVFVLTHVDDLRRKYNAIEKKTGFGSVKEKIRKDLDEMLKANVPKRIFLISNGEIECNSDCNSDCNEVLSKYDDCKEYEFDNLIKQIHEDFAAGGEFLAQKGQAFAMASTSICKSAIQAKANALRTQSIGWSILSGLIGTIPIPGVSAVCDAGIIIKQAKWYFDAFGLDRRIWTNLIGNEPTYVAQLSHLIKAISSNKGKRVAAMFSAIAAAHVTEESLKFIPIVGSAFGAGASITTTKIVLAEIISYFENEALEAVESTEQLTSS